MGGDLHIVSPSLPSMPRKVPSEHGTESSILYLHSPGVRPKVLVRPSGHPLIRDSLNYDYPFSEHYSFNVETIYSIQVSYDTPTIPNEKNFAYVESSKISMQVDHEKNALGAGYMIEFIHDATENYYERGTYACRNCNNIKFPHYVLQVLSLCLFCLPMLVDYCSHKLFAHKIPMHRKWVRLKCASHILHDALLMFQLLSFM